MTIGDVVLAATSSNLTEGATSHPIFSCFVVIFGLALLLVAGFIIWSKALRKEVIQKTEALRQEIEERVKSEEALRLSQEKFTKTFRNNPAVITLTSMENGQFVEVNESFLQLSGYRFDEIVGRSTLDLDIWVNPAERQRYLDLLQKHGCVKDLEADFYNKSGEIRNSLISGEVIGLQDGKYILSVILDITDRKKNEVELQIISRKQEELEFIINKSRAIVFLWRADAGWPVEYVSDNVRQIGYTPQEFIDGEVSYVDVIHGDDLERVGAEVAYYSQSGVTEFRQEYRLITKSGDIIWTDDVTWIRRDSKGTITHYQGIVLDITERKKGEEELQRINEELRAVNDIIMTCASTMDAEKILNKVMDEALQITGLEGGTICYVTPEETLHIAAHRETSEATIEDLTNHVIKVGECLCGECARDHKPLILADREAVLKFSTREATRGEDIRFHAAFPLVSGERCVGVLCIFTRTDAKPTERSLQLLETVSAQIAMAIDNAQLYAESVQQAVTLEDKVQERTAELDKTQEALLNLVEDINNANTKLKELDKLKSMFIASMSHELRTPLNSIIGFSGIILGNMVGEINDEQRDMLDRVSRSGKHLLSLITDVIDIAKIESGKIAPYPEKFMLADVVSEAVGQVQAQATEKGLVIEQQLPKEPIAMYSDQRRLLQCLLNYLSNAVKFSEKGRVVIAVKIGSEALRQKAQSEWKDLPEGWVEISVSDTGIGIKKGDMERLFGSFVRLETPLKTITPGTGLGLYLTKKLATEVLSGRVGVESEEGKGTRFWLEIPVYLKVEE